jgi:hypothetical protein
VLEYEVFLETGVGLGGFQFDAEWDLSQLEVSDISLGDIASGMVLMDEIYDDGSLRAIGFAFGTGTIEPGSGTMTVLTVEVYDDTGPGTYPIDLTGVMLSDTAGTCAVPTAVVSGAISVL